jgi:hypothetical protein
MGRGLAGLFPGDAITLSPVVPVSIPEARPC